MTKVILEKRFPTSDTILTLQEIPNGTYFLADSIFEQSTTGLVFLKCGKQVVSLTTCNTWVNTDTVVCGYRPLRKVHITYEE